MYLFLYFTTFTFRTFVFVLFMPFSFATYQASFLQWESFRKTPEDWEIILKKVTIGYGTGSHWNILIKAPPILVALFSGLLDWIILIRDLVLKISFPCSSCLWLLTPSLPECLMEFCKASLTFESAHEILWCGHSNERSLPVLSQDAICLSKIILENEIWKFGRNLPLTTFGSERVKTDGITCYIKSTWIRTRLQWWIQGRGPGGSGPPYLKVWICHWHVTDGSHKNAEIWLFAICFMWFGILWADLVVWCLMLDFSEKWVPERLW